MEKFVIIVAGGKGLRFNSQVPKQFLELDHKPVLMHSLEAFYTYQADIHLIVVLPADQVNYWVQLCEKYQFPIRHQLVIGGDERYYSVKNGLDLVPINCLVAVHDGVRPLVDQTTIDNCFSMAATEGNAIPVVDLTDSVRELQADGNSLHVDRQKYKLIQTPQVFESTRLKEAYKQGYSSHFTDDASVYESLWPGTIKIVEGNRQNIKITKHEDLIHAESIIRYRRNKV
jgi:2-C-methyl-D-erythritol 4-phosphate cytidylyltransferase